MANPPKQRKIEGFETIILVTIYEIIKIWAPRRTTKFFPIVTQPP